MDKRLNECLQGKQGSYILPFLWLHGESQERIYEEILAIKNSGISEFCAESRPYEGFCGEQWWGDFGFILKTAKELNMRVWLLDDQKFPTGYANGYLEKPENAHLRKRLVREIQIEALGPSKCTKLYVGGRMRKEEKVIQAIAFRHTGKGEELDYKTAIDLTDKINDNMIYWDVPSGLWRVCVTIETLPYEYENDRLFNYIDMLNPQSCHAMIDAIYEPHYKHFSEYFGNTFAGFFSDEPGFLNICYTYFNRLGDINSPYPWRDDLIDLIAESASISKEQARLYLPALWEDLGKATPLIRSHYMDAVTKLYRESFSYLLGNWCREHNVMYIGHVIEDMGAHMRLGYGSGHFFRALDGQDMAGIDIVLMQDIPGISDSMHRSPLCDGGIADPTFFRYTLPKLASSHSHIQPLKKGRAMCEIFGAFGWAEGLPFMKGLADIMLCSGVNHFVPHAFSPKEEDTDCPPHFYNGGKNIQYPLFKNLMEYMGRTSHMITEGTHIADVAVFYNAEGEWANKNGHLFFDACKALTKNAIDFDIVPYDYLLDSTVENGRLCINNESYGALIVSPSPMLPYKILTLFADLAKKGVPVIFVDSLPFASCEGNDISSLTPLYSLVELNTLPSLLKSKGLYHVMCEGKNASDMRFYHITRDNCDIYLFSNENITESLDVTLTLNHNTPCLAYEPWENKVYTLSPSQDKYHLVLENGNMLFLVFDKENYSSIPALTYESKREPISLLFDISIKNEGEAEFTEIARDAVCFDISAPDKYPHFSGCVKYKTKFTPKEDFSVIDLGQVGEVCEAWLNGKYLGVRINAPYKFSVKDAIKGEENTLEFIVTSNLAHKRRDDLSSYMQIPPTGILGDIYLCKYEKKS